MSHGWLLVSRLLRDCEGCQMALSKQLESQGSTIQGGLPYEHEPAIRNYAGVRYRNIGKIVVERNRKRCVRCCSIIAKQKSRILAWVANKLQALHVVHLEQRQHSHHQQTLRNLENILSPAMGSDPSPEKNQS